MEERHGLRVDVAQADLLILAEQPLHVFDVARGAGDAPPELRVTPIAVAFGDVRLLFDVLPEALAVNRSVCLAGRRKRPADVHGTGRRLPALTSGVRLIVAGTDDESDSNQGRRER